MGWKNLTYSWKGLIIGGIVALISSIVMILYLSLFLEGAVIKDFVILVMLLTSVKLAWGVIFGYFIGSFFNE